VRLKDSHAKKSTAKVTIGRMEIDMGARRVKIDGKPVLLRRKEFEVLVRLAGRCGDVMSRRDLLDEVWGYKADVVSRTLDTHVCEVRRKLAIEMNEPGFVETIARVGYRMVGENER
jgi:DNA-binding response OmpR family regulator